MTTFKQKALEALKGMILKSWNTLTFQMVDQHNQTVRDCISRIESLEEEQSLGSMLELIIDPWGRSDTVEISFNEEDEYSPSSYEARIRGSNKVAKSSYSVYEAIESLSKK